MAHPKGGYRNADGVRIPGTTTITGRFKDSGGLLHWAYQQGMAAERGEINNLYDKRDEAADSGTLAHAMVEAYINGDNPDKVEELKGATEEVIKQARKAFGAYRVWESMTKLEIKDQEMQLVSEKHQFGGCPDAVGIINGELCIIDWKTSNGVYPEYLLQIAAYKILWEENHPDQPITGGFHLCRFSKSYGDFSHHHYTELEEAEKAFILMRELYDIMKVLKKRV